VWPGMRATVRCIHVVEANASGANGDVNVQTLMQTKAHCVSEGQSPFARAEQFGKGNGNQPEVCAFANPTSHALDMSSAAPVTSTFAAG
jgi:hypothetical protein